MHLVNLGAHVLDALFLSWIKGHIEQRQKKEHEKTEQHHTLEPEVKEEPESKVNFSTNEWEDHKKEKKRAKMQKKEREKVKLKTKPFVFPAKTQITISEVNMQSDISRGLYSKTVSEFNGKEKIPRWVLQAILHNTFKCRVSTKVGFFISSTGPLLAAVKKKFTAIRLLPVFRYVVARGHVLTSFRIIQWISNNIKLPPHSPTADFNKFIEILCNGKVVPADINLASVLQLYWRSSTKALLLEFRVNLDHSGL